MLIDFNYTKRRARSPARAALRATELRVNNRPLPIACACAADLTLWLYAGYLPGLALTRAALTLNQNS